MDGLGIDSIMDGDELSSLLFGDTEIENVSTESSNKTDDELEKKNEKVKNTAETNPDSLFDEEESENVGSDEENIKETQEDTISKNSGTSPNFFSSIATSFAEEGIFPDLDKDTIENIKDAQSLRDAIVDQINAGLTEQQKRVIECLDSKVEPEQIKQYENLIDWLDNQTSNIDNEDDEGDDLRRRIILHDYIIKGFNESRAKQRVDKIFEEGSDKDEAKESLQSLKDYYTNCYKSLRDSAKKEAEKEVEERNRKAEKIKKYIIEDNIKFFDDMELSKETRQLAYDAVSKPVYKDNKTGIIYTAVQKYQMDNEEEFLAKIGLLYTLTDGFKSIKGLVNKKVQKEVKRGFSELERKINNTSRNSFGNLDFTSGVSDDNAFIGKGMKLDI